jgi:hypothetical protein
MVKFKTGLLAVVVDYVYHKSGNIPATGLCHCVQVTNQLHQDNLLRITSKNCNLNAKMAGD